jgi:hypothetical protein
MQQTYAKLNPVELFVAMNTLYADVRLLAKTRIVIIIPIVLTTRLNKC